MVSKTRKKRDGRPASPALKRNNVSPFALATRERASVQTYGGTSTIRFAMFFSLFLHESDGMHFGCVKQRPRVVCDARWRVVVLDELASVAIIPVYAQSHVRNDNKVILYVNKYKRKITLLGRKEVYNRLIYLSLKYRDITTFFFLIFLLILFSF